jgi:hypothetical protein
MYEHGGDSGNHRGRRESQETRLRQDALQRRERAEAGMVRQRLESLSGRGERRAPLGGFLAGLAVMEKIASRSPETTLSVLRRLANGGLRRAAAERVPGGDDARDERHTPELRATRVRDARA